MSDRVFLIVLDGCALGDPADPYNAVARAPKPFLSSVWNWDGDPKTPQPSHLSLLKTDEASVGLPPKQVGGSEVGHMTLGAGRPIKHLLTEINEQMESGEFFKNPALVDLGKKAKARGRIHLMGLISDGGIHSYIGHLHGLQRWAKGLGIQEVFIHAITDGRDVGERTAAEYLSAIEAENYGEVVSVSGRYFAMDRDHNWDRTEKFYQTLTTKKHKALSWQECLKRFYAKGQESDYYLPPTRLSEEGVLEADDILIFFNFRTDRARQIAAAISEPEFPHFSRSVRVCAEHFGIFGPYSNQAVQPLHFSAEKNFGFAHLLAEKNKTQLRVSETEKFNHVTFFFSLQTPQALVGEKRILVPSPKCRSYAEKPEMSAHEQTQAVLKELEQKDYDFVLQNFANPDLVGHSGDFSATRKAVSVCDECLAQLVPQLQKKGYHIIITADHGNSDQMRWQNGEPHASHTHNLVPLVLLAPDRKSIKLRPAGTLADVAPTALEVLSIPKPSIMTGTSLIEKSE